MDIVHHSLIGGAGFLVAASQQQELSGMAFLFASVFPDLDVLFMAFGKRFYLRNHQGITHSLILSPVYALLVASPLLTVAGFDWLILASALVGLWVHIGLDLSNTFRIGLFSPFFSGRRSLDAVFFIDAVALVLTGLFYLCYGVLGIEQAATIYPALFAGYVIAKAILQRRIKTKLGCAYAIPSSLNPLEFYVLELDGERVTTYLYNAATHGRRDLRCFEPIPMRYRKLAEKSPLFNDMRRILRHLRIVDIAETDAGTVVHAADLAIRNFGGKFGETRLRFDKAGELIDEVANI